MVPYFHLMSMNLDASSLNHGNYLQFYQLLVQAPGQNSGFLGVNFNHLVESTDLFFLEAKIADNVFSGMY